MTFKGINNETCSKVSNIFPTYVNMERDENITHASKNNLPKITSRKTCHSHQPVPSSIDRTFFFFTSERLKFA